MWSFQLPSFVGLVNRSLRDVIFPQFFFVVTAVNMSLSEFVSGRILMSLRILRSLSAFTDGVGIYNQDQDFPEAFLFERGNPKEWYQEI